MQAQILNLMRSLQDRYQLTYVVISHDLSLLKYLADRVGVMYLGPLVELGTSEEVYRAPRHPYTAGLIQSIPLPDPAASGPRPRPASAASCLRRSTRQPAAGSAPAARSHRWVRAGSPALHGIGGLHAVACHHPLTGGSDTEPVSAASASAASASAEAASAERKARA